MVAVAGLVLASALAACGGGGDRAQAPVTGAEPTAGDWRTWVIANGSEIDVPPPPGRDSEQAIADRRAVKDAAARRTPATQAVVDKWSGPLPTRPWTELAFDFVSKGPDDPPLATRDYALLEAAMADAVITSYHWKYEYEQAAPTGVKTMVPLSPDPSYPSEHAAIAGAASKVLSYLFPSQPAQQLDDLATEAAESRVDAGTNTPSDIEAGLAIGQAVADRVINYAAADGTGTPWNGKRPAGVANTVAFWQPPAGAPPTPVDPQAGKWKAWVLTDNAALRPPPPPAYTSTELKTAAQDAVDVKKRLTDDQKRIASVWEVGEGSKSAGGVTLDAAMADIETAGREGGVATRWTVPRVTRAMAMVAVTLADAGISVWEAKYTYWYPRPENVLRSLGVDKGYTPLRPTPRSPAYPSVGAGYAGGAEAILTSLFPERAAAFKARSDEQVAAGLYAGAQWRFDAAGAEAGRRIAALVIDRVKADRVGKKA